MRGRSANRLSNGLRGRSANRLSNGLRGRSANRLGNRLRGHNYIKWPQHVQGQVPKELTLLKQPGKMWSSSDGILCMSTPIDSFMSGYTLTHTNTQLARGWWEGRGRVSLCPT